MQSTVRMLLNWRSLLIVAVGFALCGVGSEARAQGKRPRFLHQTPSSVKSGQSVTLKGVITNAADLDYATLKYRAIGSSGGYRTKRLQQKGSQFYVTLPASLIRPPGIEYYVVGTMFSGRSRILAGSLSSPLQFLVIKGIRDDFPRRRPPPDRRDPTDPDPPPDRPTGPTKGTKRKGGGEWLNHRQVFSSTAGHSMPLHLAPGTTSLLTSNDIKNHGWRTLLDVLRQAGGLDINRGSFYPDIGIRGFNYLGSGGSGLLMMVDGHDMSFRQMQRNFLNSSWISVDDIERIEIVRGAFSGVWGRGAQHGVINIITKSGRNMRGYSATLGVGPLSGSHFFTVRGGDRFDNGLSIYTTLSLHQDYRSPVSFQIYEFSVLEQFFDYTPTNDRLLGQNFYFKANYKGLFFTVHQSRQDASLPLNPYSVLEGDDTRFVTDRIILRLGWGGKIGKDNSLRVWVGLDRMAINPDSTVAFNPLSTNPGNPPDGRSGQYRLNGTTVGTPCDSVSDENATCVQIMKVTYTEGGEDKTEDACVVAKKSENKPSAQPKAVPTEQKNKTWFPYPASCTPLFTGGRHNRQLRGDDTRFLIGLRGSFKFIKWLRLNAGVDFEYLQSTLWHFPTVWAQQIRGQNTDNELPVYGNYRIGAYVQGVAQFGKVFGAHLAARIDFDERIGSAFSPTAGIVVTPGAGVFIKAHYSMGFRSPSLYELFSFEDGRYGNPGLINETAHNVGLQVGWVRNKLFYVALNGYFAYVDAPIVPRQSNDPSTFIEQSGEYTFEYPTPKPTGPFTQIVNRDVGYEMTGYGGELEARLLPFKGLEFIGHFGLALTSEVINDQGEADRIPYAAGLYASLSASYRYKLFRISLGVLYVGSKLLPNTSFNISGNLPASKILNTNSPQPLPSWGADTNPRAPTQDDIPRANGYVQLHLTIQLLRIFKHLDIALRAQNVTGLFSSSYDVGQPLLMPHKKFELLTWIQYNY